ncbi:MAG: hypothetical protein M1600_08240, partial [Firmicutes bacterium]|nr:hypothetical protein [Bacillota bacterium]
SRIRQGQKACLKVLAQFDRQTTTACPFGSEPDPSILQPRNLPKIPAHAFNPSSDFQTHRSVGLQLPDLSDLYDRVYKWVQVIEIGIKLGHPCREQVQ